MSTTRSCRRCRGTGHEPAGPAYNAEQDAVLDRLAGLSTERAALQARRAYMSSDGRKAYDQVLGNIRAALAAADELGIQALDLQDAMGISSAAYYKIKNGRTGG